jgi:mRNA interferase MazF
MPTSDPEGPFEAGTVVKVPFPYTDRTTRQRRPALVVSAPDLQGRHGLCWVVMITSAVNRGWEGDVDIDDLPMAGLPVPSVIRTAKIATIEAGDAAPLGRIDAKTLGAVRRHLGAVLGTDGIPRESRRSSKR